MFKPCVHRLGAAPRVGGGVEPSPPLICMYELCVRSLRAHWYDSGLLDWPWVTNFRTLEVKAFMYALHCILFSGTV